MLGMVQLQGFQGRPVLYKGVRDCFTQMLKNEGPRSFYRGMLCSYLKVGRHIVSPAGGEDAQSVGKGTSRALTCHGGLCRKWQVVYWHVAG